MVSRLGGGVAREKRTTQKIEPRTIGKTVM
jgi:hypothetical protein